MLSWFLEETLLLELNAVLSDLWARWALAAVIGDVVSRNALGEPGPCRAGRADLPSRRADLGTYLSLRKSQDLGRTCLVLGMGATIWSILGASGWQGAGRRLSRGWQELEVRSR